MWAIPCRERPANTMSIFMDDGHTIISAGAGGVTKLVPNGPQRITRSFNYKYPYEYINRFQTVLERKEALPLQRLNDTE